ncbi:hypothetical protein ACUN9Y_03425 [Halomonas sp. V046]|uniref:hypothetical protein n=1 Tax=Halomonas sp. V046 TaxID=3459611 RepID=UPI004043EEDC
MNTRTTHHLKASLSLSALLIAVALPLTAQADPASQRALALNAEPLSAVSQDAMASAHQVANAHIADNASAALAAARLNLQTETVRATNFAMSDDDLALARMATTG